MASLNKVFLIGNLTRDPELRYTPNGTPVVNFGLAVNRVYSTQTKERKEETCFLRIVVFGKQAESCNQFLSKGRLVFVEGRLQYRSWETEGQRRSALDIVAERVQFLGRFKGENLETEIPEEIRGEEIGNLDSDKEMPSQKSDDNVPF
jgi:single-strand DNA-binding protein